MVTKVARGRTKNADPHWDALSQNCPTREVLARIGDK